MSNTGDSPDCSADEMGGFQGEGTGRVNAHHGNHVAKKLTMGYSSHIEPGWHAWISYMVDKPPTQDPILQTNVRAWEIPEHRPNFTATRGAFKTYSTSVYTLNSPTRTCQS
jgi:NADH:ubiquinone oxidoreductase subunit